MSIGEAEASVAAYDNCEGGGRKAKFPNWAFGVVLEDLLKTLGEQLLITWEAVKDGRDCDCSPHFNLFAEFASLVPLLTIEVIAAANADLKFGSAVRTLVAAAMVSDVNAARVGLLLGLFCK